MENDILTKIQITITHSIQYLLIKFSKIVHSTLYFVIPLKYTQTFIRRGNKVTFSC